MNTKPEYIPGTCNIGPKEIIARRNVAIISAIICVVLIILLIMLNADNLWRLSLFFPATSVGIGFQQWYNEFCVAFGLKGVFNFGDIGKTYSVEQKEYFKKDQMKARKMIGIGILFGIFLTTLFYILPA